MARKKPIISPFGQWAYPGEVTIIPSSDITMKGVNYPVLGIDNLGNQQMMMPGGEYTFPGDYVTEIPQMGKGGLSQWFDEKWVDVKTGKTCGRSGKDKDGRPYPACRPSKRVNETTPKTTSEMSSSEKAKFKREKTSGKRIDYNHKRREFGGESWLDQYQDGAQVPSNIERMSPVNINVKRKKVSDNPTYQYDNEGNLLYKPDINIHPYLLDNSTRDNFWVNPKLPIKNLNPTVEELRQVAAPYYPIDNKLINNPKLTFKYNEAKPSNYQASLEQEYVLPEVVGKTFGNFPLVKDDGYSPNRRWLTSLRDGDKDYKNNSAIEAYGPGKYAYVLKTDPNNLVNYPTKDKIENDFSLNDKTFYDYLAKNNYSPDTVEGLTRELPDQIWNRAEQMQVEMRNNPEIMSWANLHNVDLGYKERYLDSKDNDDFAPKIPESIYAARLAQAGLPTNRPDYDYGEHETYIAQDPSKFSLVDYFPVDSFLKDANNNPKNKKDKWGKVDDQALKKQMAKRMGLDPNAFDNGEYLIHYNNSPITEYTPGKKYGGWLSKYQSGGLSMGDYDLTTAPKRGDYLLPDINRPSYIDEAGNKRSEYRMGVNIDGRETLIPTVVGGKQLSEDEALDRYYKTGLHMGQFNTPEEADYASRLRTARYNMLEDPIRFQADQFQVGGRAPIYTSNPNDPRLRSYNDSNTLYNSYLGNLERLKKIGKPIQTNDTIVKSNYTIQKDNIPRKTDTKRMIRRWDESSEGKISPLENPVVPKISSLEDLNYDPIQQKYQTKSFPGRNVKNIPGKILEDNMYNQYVRQWYLTQGPDKISTMPVSPDTDEVIKRNLKEPQANLFAHMDATHKYIKPIGIDKVYLDPVIQENYKALIEYRKSGTTDSSGNIVSDSGWNRVNNDINFKTKTLNNNPLFIRRYAKPFQPYIYTETPVAPVPVVEPPKPSLAVSNIDRDMYTPGGGMAREYNIGVTLQDGSKKAFRTEREYQDWKAANNLDISNAKVTEGRGYSYDYYPENKKYGGWLDQFQTGGTLPPIYTSNPRDPRIRNYQDSLNLYKEQNRLNILNDKTNYPQQSARPTINKNNLIYTGDPNKGGYVNPKIFSSNIPTFSKDIHGNLKQQYKKPTQPYIYKKPQASPIYTSDLNDPRLRAYNDSLNSYNLAPLYNKQILTNLQKATTIKGGSQANLKTNDEFEKRGLNYQLGFNRKEFPRKTVSDGYLGAIKYEYKKPVQPYIYRKPEVTPEVVETPLPVAPIEQPVKKIGYNKPIIQQFNYMSNENKAKALQKYGSVSDIPFQGVDINQLKDGGWLDQYQDGGWANFVPASSTPLLRKDVSGNAGYRDNTRVNTINPATKKAAEAAQYARRVGSISQGKTKSDYEKAREASSFVSQAEQRKGSADPLDYVLDMVNPAFLPFSGIDLVGNTAMGVNNLAKGNFSEAAGNALDAGFNAINVIPATAELRGPLKSAGKYLTTQTPLKNTYKYNPWAFKPNPEAYYRGVGKEGIKDALESRVIKSRDQDLFPSPYFARPNEFKTALYYNPDALIEAKGIDVLQVKNIEPNQIIFNNKDAGAVPLNPEWVDEVYLGNITPGVKTSQLGHLPIDDPNIRLLQKDWLRGYEEIKKPSIQNSVDNIATPNISQSASISPVAWQAQELPGLHLKSTMTDGPISKIVEPKTGLVNVEQALGIIGKESGGIDKVALIKQGLGENIPKKMDYNDFRKTVQDQLIPLEKQFSTERSDYGIDRLGYTPGKFVTKEVGGKKIHTYESDYLDNQTILFSNKDKFGRGSGAHGNPDETLGHAHYLIDKESPDVLTITQIQSDAFQGTHRSMPKNIDDAVSKLNKTQANSDDVLELMGDEKEKFKSVFDNADRKLQLDKATVENFTQKSLLDKNHQERYLQELVDYAGKQDYLNKVRVPTSETAAKVQGYRPVTTAEEIIEKYNKLKGTPEWDEIMADTPDADKLRLQKVLEGKIKGDIYDLERTTILKKYSEQPKTIKKLFGEEPKLVTDSKGNTWYEFDIPKKFKEGKGEIKAFSTIGGIGVAGAAASQLQQQKQGGQTSWLNKYK
jgi:hypothetical protein